MNKDRKLLVDEYQEHNNAYPVMDIRERNNLFFAYMKKTFDDYRDSSSNSMRQMLSKAGVFIPHAPRQAKKGKRVSKKELIAEMKRIYNHDFTTLEKMNIADLEFLIEKRKKQ